MAEEKEELIFEIKIDKGASEKEVDNLTDAIEKLKNENKELSTTNKQLAKEGKTNTKEYRDNAKQIEINRDTISKNNSARKGAIQAMKAEDNSLGALKASLAANKRERDKLNLATKEGIAEFDRLTKEIKEQNDALLEAEKAGGTYTRQVGKYDEALGSAADQTEVFGVSINSLKEGVVSMINPLTATVAGLGALAKLYVSSTQGAQDLSFAQTQLKTTFNSLGNSLADIVGSDGGGGLLSAFVFHVNKALFGVKAAAEGLAAGVFTRQLEELEVAEFEMQRIAKDQLKNAEELRQVRDEERNSLQERLDANNKLKQVIDEREAGQLEFQEKRLSAAQALLNTDKENLELQKLVKQIEFEIADVQEENAGFRSEALANDLALYKEISEAKRQQRIEDGEFEQARIEKLIETRQLEFEIETENATQTAQSKADIDERFAQLTTQVEQREAKKREALAKKSARLNIEIKRQESMAKIAAAQTVNDAIIGFAGQQSAIGKTLALFNIGLSTAEALAKGISASQSVPFPANLIAMASTIATVLGNIAKAKNILSATPTPKFAEGGKIEIGGRSHAQGGTKFYGDDGTRFEAERGENLYILKKTASEKINRLSSINKSFGGTAFSAGRSYLQTGGQVSRASTTSTNTRQIVEAVTSSIQKSNIIVTVEDINAGLSRRGDTLAKAQVM